MKALKTVRQGDFEHSAYANIKRQVELGLLPQANFQLFDRQTKAVESDVKPLALQSYILPKLLSASPVSFYEGVREWHKEKEIGTPNLSMSMLGRRLDVMDLESFKTPLPGFTYRYGFSWRELGMSRNLNRPLDALTSRRAIMKVLKAANNLGLEGNGGDVEGLLNQVDATTTVAATATWSTFASATPFEDLVKAIAAVEAGDIEVSRFNVLVHPTNWGEAARIRSSTNIGDVALIRQNIGDQVNIVRSTAIPEGTVLGVPADAVHADLLTTGMPVVVPIRADPDWVEWEVRMVAVPRVIEEKALFKITGV